MHARHRSAGNGYRSSTMGMGLSTPRISPEGSARGHGFYGSEYRGLSRAFGRGQGGYHKAYQSSPSTLAQRRSTDIFMEAGRLAAEYLVSQGVLPPSVLSTKWQNGSLKKHVGDFQDLRSQDYRLGGSVSDAGVYGRRRHPDDYCQSSFKNHFKGRRRGESSRGPDFDREYGRNGSWSDRGGKASPEMDIDGTCRHHGGNPIIEDASNERLRSVSYDIPMQRPEGSDSELEKQSLHDESHPKTGPYSSSKDHIDDGEISKISEPSSDLCAGTQLKDAESYDDKTENQASIESSSGQHSGPADEVPQKMEIDLLKFCKFDKMPTKTRSPMSMRSSKVSTYSEVKGRNLSNGVSIEVERPSHNDQQECPSGHTLPCKPHETKLPESQCFETPSVKTMSEVAVGHCMEKGDCKRSQSFSDSNLGVDNDRQSGQKLLDLRRSCSLDAGRGEKRLSEDVTSEDENKRRRESLLLPVCKAESSYFPDITENKASSQEREPSPAKLLMVGDHDNLINNVPSPREDCVSSVSYAEERELFPNSYRICDLNLAGASDTSDNNGVVDPLLLFPPVTEPRKETTPIDFDLSMCSSRRSCEYTTRGSDGKEIMIIDLENDSGDEVKADNSLEKKQGGVFMGYTHQTRTSVGIPDVNDYNDGLMVEFLGSLENISSITQGISPAAADISNLQQNVNSLQNVNTLQNEMGFQNDQGTLGSNQGAQAEEDSIFMSLGEIPLTFLGTWDQPPARGYEKPF